MHLLNEANWRKSDLTDQYVLTLKVLRVPVRVTGTRIGYRREDGGGGGGGVEATGGEEETVQLL